VDAPPVVLPDRIVFADESKALYAVTPDRGERLWRRRFPEGEVVGAPAVYGDAILFPTSGSTFRAIRASDGSDLWTRWIGTEIVSSPSVVDGTLYFMGGPILFAMECADGDDVWRMVLPIEARFAAPVLLDETLYLLGMDGVITAYRTDVE
jgi:outer membrane protein assembly factor BamB